VYVATLSARVDMICSRHFQCFAAVITVEKLETGPVSQARPVSSQVRRDGRSNCFLC